MLASLTPMLLLLAAAFAIPRSFMRRPIGQYLVVASVATLVGRYLYWRATETVFPARSLDAQGIFIWALFTVEMIAWADAAVLFAALLRRTDRSDEADRHEDRLRTAEPGILPAVDVFIATYNESLEVLEKTIVGALALEWPREKLNVYVLDDGRRPWLRAFCAEKGAGYLTRSDNAHAKAGNINAAIARTSSPFFLVLDADFIPRHDFLYRAIGFFDDPTIGIVQIPHNFFNRDPMQTSLELHQVLPDDQRLFFDAIMPGRDGWDCAFCCGSNSITRRTAIEAAGGGLPTGSVTEDMLLTLVLLRKGFKTRYLNERLAVGLAPESISAFFVQRGRWARGAIQMLFLRDGPLGPGLGIVQRLMFLPTHWLSQSLSQVAAMATPAIFLWTGLLPLLNANTELVLNYQAPAILGALVAMRLLAPGQFFPLAATAHGVLQAFRLMPTILATLVKPHGHAFKVTPKGRDAAGGTQDGITVILALGVVVATALGLFFNADFNRQVVGNGAMVPVVAFWAILNMVVLVVVATIAVSPTILRSEERFDLRLPARLRTGAGTLAGETRNVSMSGCLIALAADGAAATPGEWILLDLDEVGRVAALVRRVLPSGLIGVEFHLPTSPARDRLIRALFTRGLDNSTHAMSSTAVTLAMLARVVRRDRVQVARPAAPRPEMPTWLREALAIEDQPEPKRLSA